MSVKRLNLIHFGICRDGSWKFDCFIFDAVLMLHGFRGSSERWNMPTSFNRLHVNHQHFSFHRDRTLTGGEVGIWICSSSPLQNKSLPEYEETSSLWVIISEMKELEQRSSDKTIPALIGFTLLYHFATWSMSFSRFDSRQTSISCSDLLRFHFNHVVPPSILPQSRAHAPRVANFSRVTSCACFQTVSSLLSWASVCEIQLPFLTCKQTAGRSFWIRS